MQPDLSGSGGNQIERGPDSRAGRGPTQGKRHRRRPTHGYWGWEGRHRTLQGREHGRAPTTPSRAEGPEREPEMGAAAEDESRGGTRSAAVADRPGQPPPAKAREMDAADATSHRGEGAGAAVTSIQPRRGQIPAAPITGVARPLPPAASGSDEARREGGWVAAGWR